MRIYDRYAPRSWPPKDMADSIGAQLVDFRETYFGTAVATAAAIQCHADIPRIEAMPLTPRWIGYADAIGFDTCEAISHWYEGRELPARDREDETAVQLRAMAEELRARENEIRNLTDMVGRLLAESGKSPEPAEEGGAPIRPRRARAKQKMTNFFWNSIDYTCETCGHTTARPLNYCPQCGLRNRAAKLEREFIRHD